jgi:hypothetical protein
MTVDLFVYDLSMRKFCNGISGLTELAVRASRLIIQAFSVDRQR